MATLPDTREPFEILLGETQKDSFYPTFKSLSEIELQGIIDKIWAAYETQFEGIVDKTTLKRGIYLAQDSTRMKPSPQGKIDATPLHENSIDVFLSEQDRVFTPFETAALEREENGDFKSITRGLFIALVTCAVGAIVQGWSQESLVGANLNWPVDLNIATRSDDGSVLFKHNGSIKFGLVNAIPYFATSLFGAWVSDPITNKLGRRSALFLAGLFSFAAPIGGSYSCNWYELLICRAIQGVGMGAKSSVVPILESEVSPYRMRGRLLVSWQTFVAVGIFLGASANCIFEGQWRQQLGIAFVPALILMVICYMIRESPRWLIKKRKYKEAYIALKELRETPLQAARDLYLIHARLNLEEGIFSGGITTDAQYISIFKQGVVSTTSNAGFFKRVIQLFTTRRNRNAVLGSCVAMAAQQFSGINVYAFLATTIFGNSGIEGVRALWFTFGFALTNAIFSGSAFFVINKLGRRTLLLASLIGMFPLLILTGHFFEVQNVPWAMAFIIIYTMVYSPGAGVIPFMYSSEVFPSVHREAGMSLAVCVNFGLAGALAMAVPQYFPTINTQKLLDVFAGLDGLAVILVWLFMRSPEEAVTLEEMNYQFLRPASSYVCYQIKVVLSSIIKYPFRRLVKNNIMRPAFTDWECNKTRSGSDFHMEGYEESASNKSVS